MPMATDVVHPSADFVLGLDLDGVVMDFYAAIRPIAARWLGVDETTLTDEVTFNLGEWGLAAEDYPRLHRYAVLEQGLFLDAPIIPGAAQSLRRLSDEGVRIRIITHRLFVHYCHRTTIQHTVTWLDAHAIPYWDLCFLKEKGEVNADLYLEDAPHNLLDLMERGRQVIAFTNSTNRETRCPLRADDWPQAEELIRSAHLRWQTG